MSRQPRTTDYLRSAVSELWPQPATSTISREVSRRRRNPGASWIVLPSLARPRLLLPEGVPAAAAMLRRYDATRREAGLRKMLEIAFSHGVLTRLPVPRLHVEGDAGVAAHLERVLGQQVRIGIILGTERANRKPVLQVFDAEGGTLAFVKVAGTPGTTDLLAAEAVALDRVAAASPSSFVAPRVLDHSRWGELSLLVLSPLPASQLGVRSSDPETAAMAELAQLSGLSSLSSADLTDRQLRRLRDLPTGPLTDRVATCARALHAMTAEPVPTGTWHGDWAPWNMARSNGRLQVWDWERSTTAPVGFDALHHASQLAWQARGSVTDALRSLEGAVDAVFDALHLTRRPGCLRALYLLEICLRYLADQPDGTEHHARPRTRWVLAQLEEETRQVTTRGRP